MLPQSEDVERIVRYELVYVASWGDRSEMLPIPASWTHRRGLTVFTYAWHMITIWGVSLQ